MKSLIKIYGKYIASTWAIFLLVAAANAAVLFWVIMEGVIAERQIPQNSISQLEEKVFQEGGSGQEQFLLKEGGEDFLKKQKIRFLMVLDDDGNVVYSWNCPEGFQTHYTAGEIAAFSRWYLEDYPVRVWRGDRGLLVAGNEKGSLWKYTVEFKMKYINQMGKYFAVFLSVNLIIVLTIIGVMGYSFYRSLRPLSEGIEALAKERRISLPVKGVTSMLSENLNRTSDILEQQRIQLERRDTARTEWIAGVSHDIRTPLSIIMGYADELENESGLLEEERKKAGVIRNQSIKIRKLIEDLNLTSKLEYQMQPLRIKEIHPAALLRALAAEVLNEGIKENCELELFIEPELEGAVMKGDEELIRRALNNLINNSMRHNEKGCRVFLSGSRQKEAGKDGKEEGMTAVFSVRDDGKGIPGKITALLKEEDLLENKEEKPHIMGLRIVKQIVLAHGGRFEVKENGHCVELSFPLSIC